jgi:hypothetical protein
MALCISNSDFLKQNQMVVCQSTESLENDWPVLKGGPAATMCVGRGRGKALLKTRGCCRSPGERKHSRREAKGTDSGWQFLLNLLSLFLVQKKTHLGRVRNRNRNREEDTVCGTKVAGRQEKNKQLWQRQMWSLCEHNTLCGLSFQGPLTHREVKQVVKINLTF